MANYDSQLTGAQIESALEAVHGLIVPANNGKIICVDNGVLAAKSAVEIQGGTIDALSVTANGTYTHAALGGYSPITVNVQEALQSLSVNHNGTYTPSSGYTGFSQVVVAVPSTGDAKAVVKVTHDSGYVCTATDGTTTLTSDTSTTWLFCLPNSGTWTFSCNGIAKTATVTDYTYTELMVKSYMRVGGKIFYIDSSVTDVTYTFYDSSGNELSDVQVGDEPYYYLTDRVPTSDKYYVFNNSLVESKRWTYQSDGAWVYNLLGTGTAIGTGKTNTATVMAADDGKYVTETGGGETVWSYINSLRTSLTGGCNDWFAPSKMESDALRTAVDEDGNNLVSWYDRVSGGGYILSSSENGSNYAHSYSRTQASWYSVTDKNSAYKIFAIRSF